jgi:hypothetical protein
LQLDACLFSPHLAHFVHAHRRGKLWKKRANCSHQSDMRFGKMTMGGCTGLVSSAQDGWLEPELLARFSLVDRQLGDGVQVVDAGEVGVLLPEMERLADAGVDWSLHGITLPQMFPAGFRPHAAGCRESGRLG